MRITRFIRSSLAIFTASALAEFAFYFNTVIRGVKSAFNAFANALSYKEPQRVSLTVGVAQFFKPKIKAFLDRVAHLTPDRYCKAI